MNNDIQTVLIELVIQIINPNIKSKDINFDEELINYGMNSISFLRLLFAIEEKFDMEFDEMLDSSQFSTINKILTYLKEQCNC